MVPRIGPKKAAGAADIDGEKCVGGFRRRHGVEGDDFVDHHVQPAGDAGKETGQRELIEAGSCADRSRRTGFVRNCRGRHSPCCQAASWVCSFIQDRGDESPDQVRGNRPARAEVYLTPSKLVSMTRSTGMPPSPPKKVMEHQRCRRTSSPRPHRDHRKRCGALLGHQASRRRSRRTDSAETTGQRHQFGRQPKRSGLDQQSTTWAAQ